LPLIENEKFVILAFSFCYILRISNYEERQLFANQIE